MDGYNAIIQITTNDGTSGFEVQNSIGATSFLADSDGDGYFAKRLGIGTENPEAALEVIGKIRTDELQVTSSAQVGYILTSDGDGNATWQPPGEATELILDGYVRDETFQENKTFWNEAIYHLTVASDGYVLNTTFEENKSAQEEINDNILASLDGYTSVPDTSATGDGYIAFFTGTDRNLAGDNDLYFDRVNNQLQVSGFKLTTTPIDGYVLTSDTSGNATWQLSSGAPHVHRALDQLVHNIAEDSFEEYTYSGAFVTNITIWNDSTKTIKIREEQFTYSAAQVTQLITIQYDASGVETERITENYTYSGSMVTSITRILS